MSKDQDEIVKIVELAAPVSRVWTALTDHEEFGQWFRVDLDQPFEVGKPSTGKLTYPGSEGVKWWALVERMDAERLFSFRWHHTDIAPDAPPSEEPTMLVEFTLEPTETGTRLTIRESGFAGLPEGMRLKAIRGNIEGWDIQAVNIATHVKR